MSREELDATFDKIFKSLKRINEICDEKLAEQDALLRQLDQPAQKDKPRVQ